MSEISYFCPSCGGFMRRTDVEEDLVLCRGCGRLHRGEECRTYSPDARSDDYKVDAHPKAANISRTRKRRWFKAQRLKAEANRI